MIRLAKGVLAVLGLCLVTACGRREMPPSNESANNSVAVTPVAVEPVTIETMLDEHAFGKEVNGRYYLSVARSYHGDAYKDFFKAVAFLETRGWKIEPQSFKGSIGEGVLYTATFIKADKRVSSEENVPPELIMNNGQGR